MPKVVFSTQIELDTFEMLSKYIKLNPEATKTAITDAALREWLERRELEGKKGV